MSLTERKNNTPRCLRCLEDLASSTEIASEYHQACSKQLFGTENPPKLLITRSELIASLGEPLAPPSEKTKVSISGHQPKFQFSIHGGKVQFGDKSSTFILKPSPEKFPNCAANEHAMMLCMAQMGLPTPPMGLLRLLDGELAYVIKRFDKDSVGQRILRCEDMAQILGRQRDIDGQYKYDGTYEETFEAIRVACNGNIEVLKDAIRRLYARFILGDGDYHLKNISLIAPLNSQAYSGLSPEYDVVCTEVYNHFLPELALEGGLFSSEPTTTPSFDVNGFNTLGDFIELGKRIGVDQKIVEGFAQEATRCRPEIDLIIHRSFLSPFQKAAVMEAFTKRRKKSDAYESAIKIGELSVCDEEKGNRIVAPASDKAKDSSSNERFCVNQATCCNPDPKLRPTKLKKNGDICSYCEKENKRNNQ